jgi:hypothetical protein
MRQAAVFNSGFMIVMGKDTAEIGLYRATVNVPIKVLQALFGGMGPITDEGVMESRRWSDGEVVIEVSRDERGFNVVEDGVYDTRVDKTEAYDLCELLFGRFSGAQGFYWPETVAEDVLEPA